MARPSIPAERRASVPELSRIQLPPRRTAFACAVSPHPHPLFGASPKHRPHVTPSTQIEYRLQIKVSCSSSGCSAHTFANTSCCAMHGLEPQLPGQSAVVIDLRSLASTPAQHPHVPLARYRPSLQLQTLKTNNRTSALDA